MGGGSWSREAYSTHSTSRGYERNDVRVEQIFSRSSIKSELDPKNIRVRESRDSTEHPASNPIILGIDVTGSMGPVLGGLMSKQGVLNTLLVSLYDRKPVTDPQVMLMGIGDVECDSGPLQATQFESDIRIAQQMEDIWLERGGGGNNHESYTLPWLFAALRCSIDSWEKREKKGFLFTVGDELPNPSLSRHAIQQFLGRQEGETQFDHDLTSKELFEMVSTKWEVFHILVEEGSNFRKDRSLRTWQELIGQRVVRLPDYTKMAEVIVSTIQVVEGQDPATVTSSWSDPAAAAAVAAATSGLHWPTRPIHV